MVSVISILPFAIGTNIRWKWTIWFSSLKKQLSEIFQHCPGGSVRLYAQGRDTKEVAVIFLRNTYILHLFDIDRVQLLNMWNAFQVAVRILLRFCVLCFRFLRSAEILCFGEISPLHWLYFCILAFVLLALCCDFVFLYFRSSARISVMCQCAHLDTVLLPSSSTFPLSIQIVHNNIIPLKYVHTKIIPISHVQCSCQYHVFFSKCDRTEKHSSQSNNQKKKFDMRNARKTPENEVCLKVLTYWWLERSSK